MSRHRCVYTLRTLSVLLLLTGIGACLQRAERRAEPVVSDPEPFRKVGIDAPDVAQPDDPAAAPLDLNKIQQAFAQAQTLTPEAAEARRQQPQTGVTIVTESFDESAGAADAPPPVSTPEPESTDRRRNEEALKKLDQAIDETKNLIAKEKAEEPPAKKPAEQPRPDLKLEGRSAGGDFGDAFRDKEGGRYGQGEGKKAKGKDGAANRRVLPRVTRKAASARIVVETADGPQALKPRAIRVLVEVQGPRARTVIDYVFENVHQRRLEGTFLHPLPADASMAGFAMYDGTARVDSERLFRSRRLLPPVSAKADLQDLLRAAPARGKGTVDWGRMQNARVVEQKRARQVYEEIVRSNVDPALMEAGAGADFEARVFPLEPKSLKRVVVAYESVLPFDGKSFRYGFVMPDEPSIVERSADVRVDTQHGKVLHIADGAQPRTMGRWTRYAFGSVAGGFDLALAVAPTSPHAVIRGAQGAELEGDAFYASLRPDVAPKGERATGRAILMIDTSLSSEEGGAYRRRAAMIRALLEKDPSIEQYAVMLFDVRPRWLHSIGWRDNTATNRADTYAQLERVHLEGATSFVAALAELSRSRSWAVDGAPTTVFLLSDGHITWGLDRVEALPARQPILGKVRWITYRFGEEANNQSLFDMLSRRTAGRTVTLLSEAEIEGAVAAHRRSPARLLSVKVEGAEAQDLVVAGSPALLFPGQAVQVAGRLPADGKATLHLRFEQDGEARALKVPLTDRDDKMAGRAFAELHTQRLIAMDDPRLDRMVVALSQRFHLANKRASFLILDNDAQAETYDLRAERLDVSQLDNAEKQARDARRDTALGLSLAEVDEMGKKTLAILRRRSDGLTPELARQPLLVAPFVGGPERAAAEVEYRKRRAEARMSWKLYEEIARTRAFAGDTAGAVRALSTAVEVRPRHGESMRLVGYALMALAQYDVAAEVFERLRLLRTFEGQAFLEEALALDAMGRPDLAARNYEILMARNWPRHQEELVTTTKHHYGRMLRSILSRARLDPAETKVLSQRLAGLEKEKDFTLTTHWSTDQVDIDLWVYEPTGEKCFYQNRETQAGGQLHWDTTDGLGPELFTAEAAVSGGYDSMVHYYGSSAPRLEVPAALLMVVDKRGAERTFLMRMLPTTDVVLMLRTDVFP